MIAEIVSNGMLSLPSTLAVVGSAVLGHKTLYMIFNPLSLRRNSSWCDLDSLSWHLGPLHCETSRGFQDKSSRGPQHGFVGSISLDVF
jgi:hypothetical protein